MLAHSPASSFSADAASGRSRDGAVAAGVVGGPRGRGHETRAAAVLRRAPHPNAVTATVVSLARVRRDRRRRHVDTRRLLWPRLAGSSWLSALCVRCRVGRDRGCRRGADPRCSRTPVRLTLLLALVIPWSGHCGYHGNLLPEAAVSAGPAIIRGRDTVLKLTATCRPLTGVAVGQAERRSSLSTASRIQDETERSSGCARRLTSSRTSLGEPDGYRVGSRGARRRGRPCGSWWVGSA